MIKKYFVFFIIAHSAIGLAQEQALDTVKKHRSSNEYIELYSDYIQMRLGFSNSFNSFHIKDESSQLDFTLSPNQRLRSTLTFIYKFIEIDLGYTPEFIRFNKDDAIRGKTKFYNLGTRLYFGKWMQNIQYAKTKGFYVDKSDIGIDENILFPHFQVQKIGGSTSYIFNPNFSFRSIFMQGEWQKKSAGTFAPSISYYFTQIKDNNPGTDNSIDMSVGPAYYYNWAIGQKFLVSAGAYAGIGYNYTKTTYIDATPDETIEGLSFQTEVRFTLGYNSEKFYGGATSSLNSFYYDADPKTHIQDRQQFFELYVGYRFKGPEKINKILDDPTILTKKKID